MIERIIEYSIRNKFFVILVTGVIIAAGIYSMLNIPLDAIPDLSDVQVIIYTEYPGQAPQVVEDQITYPLTTTMLAVPYAKTVRGYSFFGFSLVYIIFEDGTDLYWARSRVLEYLSAIQARLPSEARAQLGPDATGVGWVYEYALVSKNHNSAGTPIPAGLVSALRAGQRGGRRRGGQCGRVCETVSGYSGSRKTAGL